MNRIHLYFTTTAGETDINKLLYNVDDAESSLLHLAVSSRSLQVSLAIILITRACSAKITGGQSIVNSVKYLRKKGNYYYYYFLQAVQLCMENGAQVHKIKVDILRFPFTFSAWWTLTIAFNSVSIVKAPRMAAMSLSLVSLGNS